MHYAIVSCVHANQDAFRAVIADAEKRGVERVVCLGDLVGFGPDPAACVDLAREKTAITLRGCHDTALLELKVDEKGRIEGASNFPPATRNSIIFAKEDIERDGQGAARMEYMSHLTNGYENGGIGFCHASPKEAVQEYLFPEDVKRDTRKLGRAFLAFQKVTFVGHTHRAGVFLENPLRWTAASELDNYFHYKKGEKVIVNVGSCGQPRDGDPRACYLEIQKNELYWRRVEYDVEGVASRIRENEKLAKGVAQRLLRGL